MRNPAQVVRQTLLGGLIALGLIVNLIWLRIDTRPPRWDEAAYLLALGNERGHAVSPEKGRAWVCALVVGSTETNLCPWLRIALGAAP